MPEQKGIYSVIPTVIHDHSSPAQGGLIPRAGLDGSIVYSGFRVYLGTVQSILATTETIIEFDNINYDFLSMFNTSTHKFTCPYAGMWKLYVCLTIGTVVANYQLNIRFINESATVISQCWKPLISGIGINSIIFEDTSSLASGDTVRVQVYCANALTLQNGADRTFFTVRWYL